MAARKEYTTEFNDQAVKFVLEEIEPDESRKQACKRLASKPRPAVSPGTVVEL